MPGFETIDQKGLNSIKKIFTKGGVLFRHGFNGLRSNSIKLMNLKKFKI